MNKREFDRRVRDAVYFKLEKLAAENDRQWTLPQQTTLNVGLPASLIGATQMSIPAIIGKRLNYGGTELASPQLTKLDRGFTQMGSPQGKNTAEILAPYKNILSKHLNEKGINHFYMHPGADAATDSMMFRAGTAGTVPYESFNIRRKQILDSLKKIKQQKPSEYASARKEALEPLKQLRSLVRNKQSIVYSAAESPGILAHEAGHLLNMDTMRKHLGKNSAATYAKLRQPALLMAASALGIGASALSDKDSTLGQNAWMLPLAAGVPTVAEEYAATVRGLNALGKGLAEPGKKFNWGAVAKHGVRPGLAGLSYAGLAAAPALSAYFINRTKNKPQVSQQ
jgi:hypothetical protein